MAWYCVACRKEIPTGQEVYARRDGSPDPSGLPHHRACVPGLAAVAAQADEPPRTAVKESRGRLIVERFRADGGVDSWLELPASLKQPLMAMVAEVADGKPQSDYPVPGGDRLVITRRLAPRGYFDGLHLQREPTGFPPEGRDVVIDAAAVPLFILQVRGV